MLVFYLFAFILVLLGVQSLVGGVRFLKYVRLKMSEGPSDFTPSASVIAPFRDLDQGFRENVGALFRQDYPAYEIIFVTDSADDGALAVVEEVRTESGGVPPSRVVIAGKALESGQKVHNLLAAVREANPQSEAFVFVDTDARPSPGWLRALVAPLADEGAGAATGYRWFVPERGGLASHLRSVWNASIASALGPEVHKNFCWGGSTAIRRATFERLDMAGQWRGTLSDDFALTRALNRANLPVHFVPACLVASLEDCDFRSLLEFTTRQLKITRVYAPHLWKAVLLGSALFVLTFFGGIALVATRAALGLPFIIPLGLLVIIFLLGSAKSYLRLKALMLVLAPYRSRIIGGAWAHLLLWPLASALYLYNAAAASLSRRIVWRGVAYELKSATETVIMPHAQGVETISRVNDETCRIKSSS